MLTPEGQFCRLLERLSLFRGKAAGTKVAEQLMAANVDTLFVVTSLNEDFNLSRIQRYPSLANEAGAEPVVILSKADLCEDPGSSRHQVQALDSLLAVETVNLPGRGRNPKSFALVRGWKNSSLDGFIRGGEVNPGEHPSR